MTYPNEQLPAGRPLKMAPMLLPTGKLRGDLTVFNWGDGTWWIMGSYYLGGWHMRRFIDHLGDGVAARDISDAVVGLSLSGPNSLQVMEKLIDGPVGALPVMGCGQFDIGLIRARVGRLSVAGDLGYEIHCYAAEHIGLLKLLLEAGTDLGIREFGCNARLGLRVEKSFGVWKAEFTQGYTTAQTGIDRWVDWSKTDFIGREAAEQERDGNGPAQIVVPLEIDAVDADASVYEPVWKDGKKVGFVTSGGYRHTVDKFLAMTIVNRNVAAPATALAVHIVGVERAARVIAVWPCDPAGAAAWITPWTAK